MAQQHFNFDIVVTIPDVVLGDTILKRKATFETLIYNKKSDSLSVGWLIEYFGNNAGDYGDKIDLKGVSSYGSELVAAQNSFIDLATQQLFYEADLQKDADGVVTDSRNYTTEFEFYNMVAETQTVNIHSLIRASALKIK